MRRAGRLIGWVLFLAAAVAALELAGRALPPPPLCSPSAWTGWLSAHDPVVAAFAVVRLLALGLAWYALVVFVAGAGARALAAARLAAHLDRLTLPPLRRLLAATMSVGLGTASLAPGPAGASAHRPSPVVSMQPTTTTPGDADALTMRELPPLDNAPEAGPTVPLAEPSPTRTWTVRPGQCFWSIAEEVLAGSLRRPVTVAEILPYWQTLIRANRESLADPDNADLVFPGQVFTVPDPSA